MFRCIPVVIPTLESLNVPSVLNTLILEKRGLILMVGATGTGKTVMAALDYQRLRARLPRARLLFVAHRKEILNQSLLTFRHALRDAAFGELWVDGQKPNAFQHVFASIQSLAVANLQHLDADWFDVLIIDEFHHAAQPAQAAHRQRAGGGAVGVVVGHHQHAFLPGDGVGQPHSGRADVFQRVVGQQALEAVIQLLGARHATGGEQPRKQRGQALGLQGKAGVFWRRAHGNGGHVSSARVRGLRQNFQRSAAPSWAQNPASPGERSVSRPSWPVFSAWASGAK